MAKDSDTKGRGDKTSAETSSAVTTRGALSRLDPMAQYMREVARYKLLSREEESELAKRYVDDGDVEAAKTLVTSNLRLVVKIAYEYRQAYKNILDIVQEGNVGLMQAVQKYDPYRGVKLSTYAAWWIRAYILRYILNNHRLVKLGTTQAQRKLFFNLRKEKARLSAMGIEPTADKIAQSLDVPEHEVVNMERRLEAGEASLDAPIANADGRSVSRVELLEGSGRRIDDELAQTELGDIVSDKLKAYGGTLEGKERAIFEQRLVAEDPLTLRELGDQFGLTRERVRQIEKKLLEKIKRYLTKEIGDGVIDVLEEE